MFYNTNNVVANISTKGLFKNKHELVFLMFDGHGKVFDVIICWVGVLHINI